MSVAHTRLLHRVQQAIDMYGAADVLEVVADAIGARAVMVEGAHGPKRAEWSRVAAMLREVAAEAREDRI